jgi:hypothetical protein
MKYKGGESPGGKMFVPRFMKIYHFIGKLLRGQIDRWTFFISYCQQTKISRYQKNNKIFPYF